MLILINPLISICILFALLLPSEIRESEKLGTLIILNTCNLVLYTVLFFLLSKVQKDVPKSKMVRTLKKEGTSSISQTKQPLQFNMFFHTYNGVVTVLNVLLLAFFIYKTYKDKSLNASRESAQSRVSREEGIGQSRASREEGIGQSSERKGRMIEIEEQDIVNIFQFVVNPLLESAHMETYLGWYIEDLNKTYWAAPLRLHTEYLFTKHLDQVNETPIKQRTRILSKIQVLMLNIRDYVYIELYSIVMRNNSFKSILSKNASGELRITKKVLDEILMSYYNTQLNFKVIQKRRGKNFKSPLL